MQAPYYPIIYVRGYAMTEGERNETAADPFCGFNLGSTVYRAAAARDEAPKKFVFESPLLRLIKDHGYRMVYQDGFDIADAEWQPPGADRGLAAKSVVVFRYYDSGSTLLGDGHAKSLTDYGRELGQTVLRVRDLVCAQEGIAPEDFRCHLVAHSMGGLVCRVLLQNPAPEVAEAARLVAKFFTYATPHNGIEALGANVPEWLSAFRINTFNRDTLAEALGMQAAFKRYGRVDYLPATALPIQNVFCMIGSNRQDYTVANGLSSAFVGHGSDGLVKIANAGLWGLDAQQEVTQSAATAYAYRSHSGPFGIVNSEEAYQNLVRFLFGTQRVDLWLRIDEVRLPAALEGKDVKALYQFETLAAPRGVRWLQTRRRSEEDSPAVRTHAELTQPELARARNIYLSTLFLDQRQSRVVGEMVYVMDLRVRVPDYEVDRKLWLDEHLEGASLFGDQLVVRLQVPADGTSRWRVFTQWLSQGRDAGFVETELIDRGPGQFEVRVDFEGAGAPGIKGQVLLSAANC